MADEYGNDPTLVAVPVNGALALAPDGTTGPTPAEGKEVDYTLPPAFRRVGLITTDGGPEFTEERDGDPIQFWQGGYTIPTGLANCTVTFTAAETNAFVRELHAGKAEDANGYVEINAGGHSIRYVLWLEEIFRNGMIRRRIAYAVTVESFQAVKSERGTVMGYNITLRISESPKLGNNHYGQWVINPGADPLVITTLAPTTGAIGATVTITGTGLTGADSVMFGAVEATVFSAVSDTSVTCEVPTGLSAGVVQVSVRRGAEQSAAKPFTVTA